MTKSELVTKFVHLQGRMIDAGAALGADNIEALLDELEALTRDADDLRDEVWCMLHPEDDE